MHKSLKARSKPFLLRSLFIGLSFLLPQLASSQNEWWPGSPNHYCAVNTKDKVTAYYSLFLSNGQRSNFVLPPGEDHRIWVGQGKIGVCIGANTPVHNLTMEECIRQSVKGEMTGDWTIFFATEEPGNCPD